jgi:lysophospholipid acyltransferase (LPLAT)-like uncharacterized protein
MSVAEEPSTRRNVPPRKSKSTRVVIPHTPTWYQRCAAGLVFGLERLLTIFLRWEWQDHSGLFNSQPSQPVIFCVWHNRLALSMAIYRKYPKRFQSERRLAALVSASKDGALLAAVLRKFGVEPVRGSSSRRGPQALLELTSWAGRGYDLAITPDGPRGPRYHVQEGVIALAQLTGLPIVAVTCHFRPKVCLRSWDRFQIPLPLAKCTIRFSEPVCIGREATEAEREALRLGLERRLREGSAD